MPEAVTIGSLLLPVRPLVWILSLACAVVVAGWLARLMRGDVQWTSRVAEFSIVVGFGCARLSYVMEYWRFYSDEPLSALYLWQPGYDPATGVAAGVLFACWHILRRANRWQRALPLIGSFALAGIAINATLWSMDQPDDQLVLQPEGGAEQTLQQILGVDQKKRIAGRQVPGFELFDVNGRKVRFSDLRGRVVVLNFWATWCAPCRREVPLLDRVHDEIEPLGATIVGVAVGEPVERVSDYLNALGVDYPVWVDGPGRENTVEIYRKLGGIGFPTTFFVDREGVVRDLHIGELAYAPLMVTVGNLLNAGQ